MSQATQDPSDAAPDEGASMVTLTDDALPALGAAGLLPRWADLTKDQRVAEVAGEGSHSFAPMSTSQLTTFLPESVLHPQAADGQGLSYPVPPVAAAIPSPVDLPRPNAEIAGTEVSGA